MKKSTTLFTALLAITILLAGCGSETAAPTAPTVAKGQIVPQIDRFMATIGDGNDSLFYVYLPPGYNPTRAAGYPTVYMLNGFGGNEAYFVALFSATNAADWLLARGEIAPMILVFPSGHNSFGGGFYTDGQHPAVGNSETHILNIIAQVDGAFHTDPTAAKRAIAGHSMGGYGAMRIALKHPGMFSSVDAIAAPLSFWGTMPSSTQYKGLEELLPAALHETGYDTILAANPAGDAAAFQSHMYPSASRRITSMLFAAAAAFSPTNPAAPGPTTIATYGVDLPVGITGLLDSPTWTRWMANDPVAMFASGAAANLAGVKVYLDAGSRDDLGFYGAHDVFAGAMARASMTPSVKTTFVDATDDYGTTVRSDHTAQTYERLKALLKWQSAQF